MNKFFNIVFRYLYQFLIAIFKILLILLLVIPILWLYNNYRINRNLQNELEAQEKEQSTWQKENITAWTCGTIRATNTVVIITPEYYEDYYNAERIATYNVDGRVNYVLTAFRRNFDNPFLVAKDLASLVKELRRTYSYVIIVGHSKGSTINIAMLNYLSDSDYDMMINISSPYNGTILAMPEKMYEILSPKKIFNWEYGKDLYNFYNNIFDGDTADKIIRKDSPFLEQLDYSKIDNDKFINITAKSGIGSFLYDFWNFDAEAMALPFLDAILSLNGDGIVPLESQKGNIDTDIKTIHINSSHKSSYKIGIEKVLKDLEK